MIKRILLISITLVSISLGQEISSAEHYNNGGNHGYHNQNHYNNSCNAGVYNGYRHGFLMHGQYTQSSKNISNGKAYVSITCNNGNLSRKVLNISCDNGYYKSGNYCKKRSNSHYNNNHNNYYNNSHSCDSGIYNGYTHPFLKNGQSSQSSKNISNGRAYVKVKCNNGHLSRTIISLKCDTNYYRSGTYCKKRYNANAKSCNSGIFSGYSYSFLKNGQSTHSSKNISHGRAYAKIKCSNGNISRKVTSLKCDSGYKKTGNYCVANNDSHNHNNYNTNSSCSSGVYNGYKHSYLSNGRSTSSSKYITNGKAYVKIHCNNGDTSRTITKISCDSGYTRSGNYCVSRNNSHYNGHNHNGTHSHNH